MDNKHTKRLLCLLFFCVLFAGLLSGCATQTETNTIYTTSGYSDPISQLFPGYKIAEHTTHTVVALDLLRSGGIIEAYDAQAETSSAYWYPLTLETIVIAVDRSQTDMAVALWNDLRGSDVPVSIINAKPVNRRMMAAALCYGLEGEDFSLNAATRLLKALSNNGKLKYDDPTTPIQICFDSDAAARIKSGENIEIIIPSEGTLSYVKGLLSNTPLDLPDGYERILFESGSRLPDGSCDETIYPAPGQYEAARALENYSHLNAVTQGWRKVMNREVKHVWFLGGADLREDVIYAAVFIIIAAIWVGSMMRRSQQKNIRRVIFVMGVFLAGWVLIRHFKWQINDETVLGRYLWFSYYLFEMILTLGLLRITSLIGTGDINKKPAKWFLALCAYGFVLGGLIITNDLHNLMFKLDLSQPGWSSTGVYGYGLLYYIFLASLLAEIIGGIVLMFIKVKHSPRRAGVIFPLIFTAVLITYVAGYSLNIPFFAQSDITIVLCLFALLFLELCIRAGQLPINTNYRGLFKNTGLNLQIADGNGNSVFASNNAETLTGDQWSGLSDRDVVHIDENTLLLKNEISGGYAVWREDITAVNKLKEEIAESNREIEAANALLSNEAQKKEQDTQIKTQIELYDAFEKDISAYEERLAEMLGSIPADEPERTVCMGAATVLACYIKRRCNLLVLKMGGNETIPWDGYAVYIDELAELAKLAGVKCLTFCSLTGEIKLCKAMLFYDFFYSVAEWTVKNKKDGMVVQIMSENGNLVMKLMASVDAAEYEIPERMKQEIRDAGGTFEKKELDNDQAGLFLSFPAKSPSPEGGVCDD